MLVCGWFGVHGWKHEYTSEWVMLNVICHMLYVTHVICYMLYVTCYMLNVICYTCYMLHVICYMLFVTCYKLRMLHVICCTLYVTCYMLHFICYMLYATRYMLHVIRYMLYVSVQHRDQPLVPQSPVISCCFRRLWAPLPIQWFCFKTKHISQVGAAVRVTSDPR